MCETTDSHGSAWAQIKCSEHLDAKKVLLRVPMEAQAFLETRALLLERLGRHQDALE